MIKLVIPCAGKGTRMGGTIPKALIQIDGHAILNRIMSKWFNVVDDFVIVVSPVNAAQIRSYVKRIVRDAQFVIQKEPKGLADAILQAEPYVSGKFIVHLGDCLFKGEFETDTFDLGIGAVTTGSPEINKNFVVRTSPTTGLVEQLAEKPTGNWVQGLCGMGVYFLDERVFSYIRKSNAMSGGGDFTEVLQAMIDAGEKIHAVKLKGEYINVTYPSDIKRAEKIFAES